MTRSAPAGVRRAHVAGMPASVRAICLAVLLANVVACGFKPRGSGADVPDPGDIFVDVTADITIADGVRRALQVRDFTVVDSRDRADVLLQLGEERQTERILTVQSTGRVSEIELSHSVSLRIAEAVDGEPQADDAANRSNRVDVIRDYTYDERGVLGKAEEARILRDEMSDELVRQIVLRATASFASIAAQAVD